MVKVCHSAFRARLSCRKPARNDAVARNESASNASTGNSRSPQILVVAGVFCTMSTMRRHILLDNALITPGRFGGHQLEASGTLTGSVFYLARCCGDGGGSLHAAGERQAARQMSFLSGAVLACSRAISFSSAARSSGTALQASRPFRQSETCRVRVSSRNMPSATWLKV
jgi:hypothetical protein